MFLINQNEMSTISNNPKFVQEVYYGKNKLLEECDGLMQKIITRNKILSDDDIMINASNEIKEIEKRLCKIFNLENCNLTISPYKIANAFTIGMQYAYDKPADFWATERGPYGVQFKNKIQKVLNVAVFSGMITPLIAGEHALTGREVMSIVLHEVGHNFNTLTNNINMTKIIELTSLAASGFLIVSNKNQSPSEKVAQIAILFAQFGVFRTSFLLNLLFKLINDFRSIEILAQIEYYFKFINLILSTVIDILTFVRWFAIPPLTALVPSISQLIGVFKGTHRDEQFADSFATTYGYGLDLVTALNKVRLAMGSPGMQALKQIEPLGWVINIPLFVQTAVGGLWDEHPAIHKRILDTSRQLKLELKTNKTIKPDERKAIEAQLDQIDKLYTQITDPKHILFKEKDVMSAFMQQMLNWMNVDRQSILDLIETNKLDFKDVIPE